MAQKEVVEQATTDLQLDEYLPQQIKGWKVQSVGLIFIFALMSSAAIGLFGDGVISTRKISQGQATIQYDRFYRVEARMELKVEAINRENDNVVVIIPNTYLQRFNVEAIVPEPAANKAENGHVKYLFEGSGPMAITFYLIPEKAGPANGQLRVNEEEFMVNHFIYP